MLDEVVNHPALEKYITHYQAGHIIFLEGDDAQDLYILVSGELEIIKGNMKINEIKEKGALFGEMSFLLDSKRTATARARDDVTVICIPREEITQFLRDFPDAAETITKALARRLNETSQILFGLKEFCDQLPDAVILTDRDGKILTWNSAAEKLYGRDWTQMQNRNVEEIYEEPHAYRDFLEEVESRYSVREKILKVRHPEMGIRYVSTSTTLLYDGQHDCQGVLSLGRDVTSVKKLERRYQRARNLILPPLILLVLIGAGLFFGYPYLVDTQKTVDLKKSSLRDQIARDLLLLKSLLAEPMINGDREKTTAVMKEFFQIQSERSPYVGLVLLDPRKRVFDAYSPEKDFQASRMRGNSYAGIEFQGDDNSLHRVLVVYRVSKEHPMGRKGLELAFELTKEGRFLGWLVFQMDVELLKKNYGVDEEGLRNFRFKKP
ncbi:MAG: cyclic nucleotide-binding domain-containing protein [Deltaproteobacteria bacterium]|nr:cyclic nucleotide-binding domain-containing protein [Deltaproteobacteria bacterium]MBW2128547.1 cyclic nucleotide-binding domain-containing protein [Deltaproteobacteria bacterium]